MVAKTNLYDLTVQERNLLAVLAQHVGSDNAITSRDIQSLLMVNDTESRPETRKLVRSVMRKTNVPIGSNNGGYYIIATADDLDEYMDRLDETIMGTMKRSNEVFQAFYAGDTNASVSEAFEGFLEANL